MKMPSHKPAIHIEGGFHFKFVVYLAAIMSLFGAVAAVNLGLNIASPDTVLIPLNVKVNGVNVVPRDAEAFKCPKAWTETRGSDPESGLTLTSCTNGRFIITARENRPPQAFDTQTGTFVDAGQFY